MPHIPANPACLAHGMGGLSQVWQDTRAGFALVSTFPTSEEAPLYHAIACEEAPPTHAIMCSCIACLCERQTPINQCEPTLPCWGLHNAGVRYSEGCSQRVWIGRVLAVETAAGRQAGTDEYEKLRLGLLRVAYNYNSLHHRKERKDQSTLAKRPPAIRK
eukprot:scaffold142371_cov22-Tisochrysis_lutea.AAC.1